MLVYSATKNRRSDYCYSPATDCVQIQLSDQEILVRLLHEETEGNGSIAGADIDPSLEGKSFSLIFYRSFALERFRERASFRDFSLFGLNMSNGVVYSFDYSRYMPLDKFGGRAVDNSCPIRIVFPDTESTLGEALIIVVTEFADRRVPAYCNVKPDAVYTNETKADRGDLFLLKSMLPGVRLEGPDTMSADSRAELVLNFESDARGLDSLCDFILETENGYLPKRKIRAGVGDAVSFPIHSTGLSVGDVMNIRCGFVPFDQLATHRITITEKN